MSNVPTMSRERVAPSLHSMAVILTLRISIFSAISTVILRFARSIFGLLIAPSTSIFKISISTTGYGISFSIQELSASSAAIRVINFLIIYPFSCSTSEHSRQYLSVQGLVQSGALRSRACRYDYPRHLFG